MKYLRGNQGESLVTVLIASAILGVVIAGVLGALSQAYSGQKSLSFSQDAGLFKLQLQTFFRNDEICTTALKNKDYKSITLNSNAPGAVDFSVQTSASEILQIKAGAEVKPGIRIGTVELVDANGGAGEAFRTVPDVSSMAVVVQQKHIAFLKITLEKQTDGQWSTFGRPITFATRLLLNPSGTIDSCLNTQSEKSNCNETGGAWVTDPSAPTGVGNQLCVDKPYCGSGGFFSGPGTFGSFPNHITGGYSCPPGSTQVQSGVLSGSYSNAKYSAYQDFYPVYECLYCGPGGPQVASGYATTGTVIGTKGLTPLGNALDQDFANKYHFIINQITGQSTNNP